MIEAKSLVLEKTVIIGIINSQQDESQSKEYLDELAFLALTAGGNVLRRFVQKDANPKSQNIYRYW
tara:strand:+ start:3377 stop:3574 length:198 start_codon:yes stop_codon:yes gene_type:complete